MCGMPFFGLGCDPIHGHFPRCNFGLLPAYGYHYPSYGHLQGYGVGLHPGYDPCGSQYGCVCYPMCCAVHSVQYVEKPFKGGRG